MKSGNKYIIKFSSQAEKDKLKLKSSNLDKNAKEMFLEAFKDYDKWNELRHAPSGSGTYHSLKDGALIKSVITSYDMKIADFLKALKDRKIV